MDISPLAYLGSLLEMNILVIELGVLFVSLCILAVNNALTASVSKIYIYNLKLEPRMTLFPHYLIKITAKQALQYT